MDTTNEGLAGDAGAAAAAGATQAAAAPAAQAGAAAAQATAAEAGATLLSQGQSGAVEPAKIPEKYQVKNADGTINFEQSALKQAQGYDELHKRLVAGEAPPKDPNEYKVDAKLPEGVNFDELKKDPKVQGFLKSMHAQGVNNKQLSTVLDYYYNTLAPELGGAMAALSYEDATAQLKTIWPDDAALTTGLKASFRAVKAYATPGDDKPGSFARLEKKFANDPDFAAFAANIGKDIKEDHSVVVQSTAGDAGEAEIQALQKGEAYWNPKHADHERVKTQVANFYQRKYAPAK